MTYINVLKAELHKYLSEIKTYYPDHVVNIIVTYIFFAGFFLGFVDNNYIDNAYYISFIYWFFASNIISEASVSISFEKQVGTFEQLLTKPVSLYIILIVRTVVWLAISIIKAIILLILIKLTLPIRLVFSLKLIPVFIITVIGLIGVGLLLSGLTLKYTKTASFESIISYILLFFTGSIIDLNSLPEVFRMLSHMLPLTDGIELSKKILLNSAVSSTDVLAFLINNLAYMLIGYSVFKYIYDKSKTYGINSSY